MTENTYQAIAAFKWFYVGGFAWLYGSGGISGKWKRRFISGTYLVAGVIGISVWTGTFSWWYLTYLSVIGAMHLGYGADVTAVKFRRRALYGLAMAVSSTGIFIVNQAWIALAYHLALCVSASVVLGVWNPVGNARNEETLIAGLSTIVPLMLV